MGDERRSLAFCRAIGYFRCTAKKPLWPQEKTPIDLSHAVAEALAQLPEVEIRSFDPEPRIDGRVLDLAILGKVKGRHVRFLIEAKSSGYPRDVQQAIRQLDDLRRLEQPVADVPLLVAPAISEIGRELLRRHKLAYWDAGGSVYIDLPWAFYWVDRPIPAGRPRVLRNIYRGSTAQVLHALLLEPGRVWHVNELARRAQVSLSTVHQVCTFLEAQLWMDKAGKGPRSVRVLRQPGALLDAWAAARSLAQYEARRFHRWVRDPEDLLHSITDALVDAGIEHALTLSSGARLVAPYGTDAERAWVLVPAGASTRLDEIAGVIDLRPVDEGEVVTFWVTRDRSPLLFRREVQGLWVASDVQLYLDLWVWPQRGKEQARHLRAERLGF